MAIGADVARQVFDLSKATFDNAFHAVDAIQRALEDAVLSAAESAGWLPGELKSVARECAGLTRRTRRDLKQTTDRCHGFVHALVDRVLDPTDEGAPVQGPRRRPADADAEAAVVH